jgi:hypothetical protein
VIEEVVVAAVEAVEALEQPREVALDALGVGEPFDLVHGLAEALLQARQQALQRALGLLAIHCSSSMSVEIKRRPDNARHRIAIVHSD